MALERVVIVPEAHHDYAVGLIQAIHERHGLRSVAVFFNRRLEMQQRYLFPQLNSKRVAARYIATPGNLPQLCEDVSRWAQVVGIVPYAEQTVEWCAQACQHLGLEWNDPQVLARFRDKHQLKEFLTKADPLLTLGHFRRVKTVGDVYSQPLPERFVIKRTNGFGNNGIGFFDRRSPREHVESHLAANRGGDFVLEEKFEGQEYAINGVVDVVGNPQVLNIVQYHRTVANGIENIYHLQTHIPTGHPVFSPLTLYAQRVMKASGLRRSPFHLEAMITAGGPRLIEVGARMAGGLTQLQTADLHGFDLYNVLADWYVLPFVPPPIPVNWTRHDAWNSFAYDGHATRDERICTVEGVEEAQRCPEFRRWVFRPQVGAMVQRTVDLYTIPFSFQLFAQRSDQELAHVAQGLVAKIGWNRSVRKRDRLKTLAAVAWQRLERRAQWEARARTQKLPPSGRLPR